MTTRREIVAFTSNDLNELLHGKSFDEGIACITALRNQAMEKGCHRVSFMTEGEYDYVYFILIGHRYETDEEFSQRTNKDERKRRSKLEKKREQLEKIRLEIEELENPRT